MKFYIDKPSYYSQHYEVDERVIKMCNDIGEYFSDRDYSEAIKTLGIVPVVAPDSFLEDKPSIETLNMYTKSIGRVTLFKQIDYEKYLTGSVEERKRLTVKCVLEAVEMIKSKKSTKFDVEQFKKDVLSFTGYTEKELEEV